MMPRRFAVIAAAVASALRTQPPPRSTLRLRMSTTMEEPRTAAQSSAVKPNQQWFDDCLEAALEGPAALEESRAKGRALLADVALPTKRQEPFRFTELGLVWKAIPRKATSERDDDLVSTILDDERYTRGSEEAFVLLVDGVVVATRGASSSGLYAGSLRDAPAEVAARFDLSEVPEAAIDAAEPNNALGSTPFAALNAACATDALLVRASSGDSALRVVHASTGERGVSHARLAVAVDDNASLRLQQIFVSLPDDDAEDSKSLCNSRTTIDVSEGASLAHVYAVVGGHPQRDNHLEATNARVAGRYEGTVLATCRSRVGQDLTLTQPEAFASLNALGLGSDAGDAVDVRSQIRHTVPDATSRQDVRLVAADRGSLLFKGRIHVPTEGQRTDAEQLCRAAVLSDTASANVMPCLDIVADDVKCAHGATVSDLDEESLFFLLCRGIRRPQAKALLVRGFCDHLLAPLADDLPPLLTDVLADKINHIATIAAGVGSS
eukprot:CAMPEP_0198662524 /NCGR_PEP_ID=MMETSP1467-20131203/47909_1 /TAXON_ID=1462469 /ORGANISM="unid. sp., Strain CCMP2135" /LENGTH=494 /DNA_ID=CAMNT_0044399017 /DNA_START=1 /DNA_END=1485 /DNA_ORIENTATION=+